MTSSPSRSTVRVPLTGKHGAGLHMLLDAADWTMVRATWGDSWLVIPTGQGRSYVCRSGGNNDKLARLLLGARRGELVIFVDGDPLNLRRSNLRHLSQTEATVWRRTQTPPRPRVVAFNGSTTIRDPACPGISLDVRAPSRARRVAAKTVALTLRDDVGEATGGIVVLVADIKAALRAVG